MTKKYVVTAFDRKKGSRENISIPLSKESAEEFVKKRKEEMDIAIPKYKTLKNFRLKKW